MTKQELIALLERRLPDLEYPPPSIRVTKDYTETFQGADSSSTYVRVVVASLPEHAEDEING